MTITIEHVKKLYKENPDFEVEEAYEVFCWSELIHNQISEETCMELYKMSRDDVLDICVKAYKEHKEEN